MTNQHVAELRSGPRNPLMETPEPAPSSMRRTWNIDVTFPDGFDGGVVADVRGRDLRVDAEGNADVLDELAALLTIDPLTGCIDAIDAKQSSTPFDALTGVCVRSGYGRRLAELFATDLTRRSLCFGVLEDLGGAQLVSGYAHLVEGIIPATREVADAAISGQADVCIGWAADGAYIGATRVRGHIPVPVGPVAPDIESEARHGWHEMAPLAHPSVRRRRRLDVVDVPGRGGLRAQEHFRDSYAASDRETVMHEYLVDAALDDDNRLSSIDIDPRVLPWRECPGAAASAQRLVGVGLDDLAARVRSELVGATTCTHLNSTLRTLADVRALTLSLRS